MWHSKDKQERIFKRFNQNQEGKQQGYHDYRSNGPLLAVVWYDCKFMYFVTTHCATLNNDLPTVMRKNKDGSREAV